MHAPLLKFRTCTLKLQRALVFAVILTFSLFRSISIRQFYFTFPNMPTLLCVNVSASFLSMFSRYTVSPYLCLGGLVLLCVGLCSMSLFRVKLQDAVNVVLAFESTLFKLLLQNTHGVCEEISQASMKPFNITLHEILKVSYTGDFLHMWL